MQIIPPGVLERKGKLIRLIALLLPVICLAAALAPTVFAQNTYVITDGEQTLVHTSYASDPAKVLSEAGLQLDEDDTYTTQVSDGVSEITIRRAYAVTVDNCGQMLELTSYGETLETLLIRSGVPAVGDYYSSVALDTATYDGMQVTIKHIVRNEETYTVEIPFETIYLEDDTLAEGAEKVITEGKTGQMLTRAQAGYVNGREANRMVLEETVLEQPVNAVIAVGTGENVGAQQTKPLIGDGVIVLPTGEVLTYTHFDTYKATAYTHLDAGCNTITATGTTVHWGTVAVDPRMIPYGTRMFIITEDGSFVYGLATAEDCGGAIKNRRIDLYMPTLKEAFKFGVKNCTVYFLGDAQGLFW